MNVGQLQAVFSGDAWPRFLTLHKDGSSCAIALHVEPTIRWFSGHFPNEPVLAGVVQTHWAAEIGLCLFSLPCDFSRLDNLKFHSVVLPGQVLTLSLEADPLSAFLKFRYHHENVVFSEGKFVFASA